MSNIFLNKQQLAALEKVIEQDRDAPGVHRELIPTRGSRRIPIP